MPAPPSSSSEDETVCLLSAQQRPDTPSGVGAGAGASESNAEKAEVGDKGGVAAEVTAASIDLVNDILGDIEKAGADDAKAPEHKSDVMSQSMPCPDEAAAAAAAAPSDDGRQKKVLSLTSSVGPPSSSSPRVVPSKTSGSLVVDVHLPPATAADEGAMSAAASSSAASATSPSVSANSEDDEVVLRGGASKGGARPSKHSVNRFQRCYSDGSHQGSPKRKRKSMPIGKYGEGGGGGLHNLQNLDRIETICEVSSSSSANANAASSSAATAAAAAASGPPPSYSQSMKASSAAAAAVAATEIAPVHQAQAGVPGVQVLSGGNAVTSAAAGFRDRFRHCSESAAALVQRLPPFRSSLVAAAGGSESGSTAGGSASDLKLAASGAGCKTAAATAADQPSYEVSALALAPVEQAPTTAFTADLPTSLINPNAKFDFFRDDDDDDGALAFNSAAIKGGRVQDDYMDDDEEEDEEDEESGLPSYRQKLLPNRVKRSTGSLASSAGSLGGAGGASSSSSGFRHPSFPTVPAGVRNMGSTDALGGGGRLSTSSSTLSMPVCRICQLPGMEPNNSLISPCRCLGSIRYVHNNCLLKWLEVSSRRHSGPPCCELCQYQYLRHKKFVISHWRFPECSLKDKVLHVFFVFCVLIMIACAAVTIICFREERRPYRHHRLSPVGSLSSSSASISITGSSSAATSVITSSSRPSGIGVGVGGGLNSGTSVVGGNVYEQRPGAGELSPPELISLACAILFFSAFFLAMYVELKARHTVYQLVCKFFYMNHEWSVEEYDRKRDINLRGSGSQDGAGGPGGAG